ncbi:MAG: metallophosphoesterase [Clostridia bacterium]|nr:metallophosphoesterase [Clostridia bacterium]
MLFRFIIVPFLMMIPVGIYLFFYLLRIANFWRVERILKKVKVVAALIAVCLSLWSVNLFGYGALIVLHIVGIALLMEVLNFICTALHKFMGININTWNKIFRSGLVPVIITGLIIGYGYYNMKNVVETDYTIHTGKLIRQDGYRIAMIADLHFGTTMNEEKLKKYCNDLEAKKPDLVVLCGDIVDQRTTFSQMKNAAYILGNIKSSYGTFYVYGNHDKSRYGSARNFDAHQLENELISNGIHVLEDEIYHINNEFTVIGRKDKGFSSEHTRKTCEELIKNVDANNFLLLLDHQPSKLQENSRAGIDLQLSGHTHGGQIWPEGLFNGITGVGELSYGHKKIDKYQIIVSSGIAGWGYPIRTQCHSEYVIVDVRR